MRERRDFFSFGIGFWGIFQRRHPLLTVALALPTLGALKEVRSVCCLLSLLSPAWCLLSVFTI